SYSYELGPKIAPGKTPNEITIKLIDYTITPKNDAAATMAGSFCERGPFKNGQANPIKDAKCGPLVTTTQDLFLIVDVKANQMQISTRKTATQSGLSPEDRITSLAPWKLLKD